MIPALSSAAPRPYSRPSRSTAVNGSDSHSAGSPGRLDVVVGIEQDGRLACPRPRGGPRRPVRPGVPSSLSHRRIRTSSMPARTHERQRPRRCGPAVRDRSSARRCPGWLTRSFSWATVASKARVDGTPQGVGVDAGHRTARLCGVAADGEVMAKTLPVPQTTSNDAADLTSAVTPGTARPAHDGQPALQGILLWCSDVKRKRQRRRT